MSTKKLNWFLLAVGIVLGLSLVAGLVFWLGGKWRKQLNLKDRGDWDTPLPEPFSKDMVVAVYKRRRCYHRHHRDYHRRRHSGPSSP